MPSRFQTCLLVTALAGSASAQVYLSLEDDQFHMKETHPASHEAHHQDHREPPHVLDHAYDTHDYHLDEEESIRQQHQAFTEVHHPFEAYDFGSPMDHYHDYYRTEEEYNPHETEPFHETVYHHDKHAPQANGLASNTAAPENVLDDDDPAICFVKAYARKPLGAPESAAAKKKTTPANGMDYWHDDYENDLDYYDDEYDDEDYDNYGGWGDFSDENDGYYDE